MNNVALRQFNLRKNLALITMILTMLILPFAFIEEKVARVIFYWCGYFSLIGLIYELFLRKAKLAINSIALSFFLLGVMYITWSAISAYYDGQSVASSVTAGKRMLLAAFIMSYITQIFRQELYPKRIIAKFALAAVTTAFVIATAYGIAEGVTDKSRLAMGIDRATLSAYAYSVLSLALAVSLLQINNVKLRNIFFVAVSLLSIYVVCLTETRAAMVIHTLLIALLALSFFHFRRNRISLALLLLAIIIGLGANQNIIKSRINLTLSDIQQYQNNNDKTSLGARFTMWKVGVLAFEHHPFGQTQLERNQWIRSWLNTQNMKKSDALLYLDVHLHNEFIQYASTFGIVGILLLFFFYFAAIVKSASTWGIVNPITISGLALLLYGATDVLLTSAEMIVIIAVLFTLMTIISEYNQSAAAVK